jgi:hypothetical protein
MDDEFYNKAHDNVGRFTTTSGSTALPDVSFSNIKIAYRPRYPDGHADPGEVVWARVPFQEDASQSKDRPVLIIGRTADGKNLVALQLTSKSGPGRVSIGEGKWDKTGRESYLRFDRLIQISDKSYRREGDYMKKPMFQGIVNTLTSRQGAEKVTLSVVQTNEFVVADDNLFAQYHIYHTSNGRWSLDQGSDEFFNKNHDAKGRFTASDVNVANPEVIEDVTGSARARQIRDAYTQSTERSEGAWDEIMAPAELRSKMAKAYEAMPVDDPSAHPSYRALAGEVKQQFDFMTSKGIKVEFVSYDPYRTAKMMTADVEAGTIKVMKTAVTGSHTFFTDQENDMFRAVHDVFGHAATGRGFDRHGERAAYVSHSEMFKSRGAIRALATETEAQNAVVHETGRFPVQKIALMPDSLVFAGIQVTASLIQETIDSFVILDADDFYNKNHDAEGKFTSGRNYFPEASRVVKTRFTKPADNAETMTQAIHRVIKSPAKDHPGVEKLFAHHDKVPVPFPSIGRKKTEPLFDRAKVEAAVKTPRLVDIPTDNLHATQPWVTKSGVQHYTTGQYERTGKTFADAHQAGNTYPVVYEKADGRRVILSGHHRAVAAKITGKMLKAVLVKESE